MIKKITSVFCAAAIAISAMSVPAYASNAEMRDITTMELVEDMGLGINLGNTYESCGDWITQWGNGSVESFETAWGSPVITQNMIQGYANEGFGVLRIPVAWSNMMDSSYNIDSEYIDAVKEVVDWTLDTGMYAIVNLHWDGGWINDFPNNETEYMKKYTAIWIQLCDEFKDYNDYLMFESQNEELGWDSLSKSESYSLVNEINQTFVDIVRNSGGNNAERHLLISGVNTDIGKTCNSLFKMPDDPASRCAVSVHYYTPATFAILEEDADWGECRSTWGTDSDFTELNKYMDMMKTNFIDKGVPVIIGEYGCPTKNKEADSVHLFLKSVCEAAYSRDMCPVLWDITDLHYSRNSCTLNDQQLKTEFQTILNTYASDDNEDDNNNNNDDNNDDNNNNNNEEVTIGDVSGNGSIDLYDAIEIAKYIIGARTFTADEMVIANYDGKGEIDLYDVIAIAKYLLKN